jgi:hypothetical protein
MKCDFIKSKSIKDKLYYNKTQMIDIKIDYPYIPQPHAGYNVPFNMYYRQKAHQNYRYASSKLFHAAIKQYNTSRAQGFPFHSYEFVEVFEPTYCKEPYVSLYREIYEFTGGAHGNTTRYGSTWDLKRNKQLSLADLFKKGWDYKYFMLQFIQGEAKRRKITGQADYFDNLTENLTKYFDEKNYYLTEKGIAIFYPLYTIAPYSNGIQVFVIPYPLFGDNLKYCF